MGTEFCLVSPRRAHGFAGSVHGRKVRLPRQANVTRSGNFRGIFGEFLCYDGTLYSLMRKRARPEGSCSLWDGLGLEVLQGGKAGGRCATSLATMSLIPSARSCIALGSHANSGAK